jgi:hypothetical protein
MARGSPGEIYLRKILEGFRGYEWSAEGLFL